MFHYETLIVDVGSLGRTLEGYAATHQIVHIVPHQSIQEHGRGILVVSYLVVLNRVAGFSEQPEPAIERPRARPKAAAR